MTRVNERLSRPGGRGLPLVAMAATLSLLAVACQSGDIEDTTAAGVADIADASDDTADSEADGAAGQADGSDGGGGDDGEPPTEAEIEEAQLAFEQCLDEAGIEVDFGRSGGEAVVGSASASASAEGGLTDAPPDFEAFEAAMDECNDVFEGIVGSFEPSPEQEAELRDAEAAFANCMAERGFELGLGGDGGVQTFTLGDDVDVDELDTASEECSTEAFGDSGLIFGGEG